MVKDVSPITPPSAISPGPSGSMGSPGQALNLGQAKFDDPQTTYFKMGKVLQMERVEIEGVRFIRSASSTLVNDLKVPLSEDRAAERSFVLEFPISQYSKEAGILLRWFELVHEADDFMIQTKKDDLKTLRHDISLSPDGLFGYTAVGAFPVAWKVVGLSDGGSGRISVEFRYDRLEEASLAPTAGKGNAASNESMNKTELVCTLVTDDNTRIPLRYVDDFGAHVATESLYSTTPKVKIPRWTHMKTGHYELPALRVELTQNPGNDAVERLRSWLRKSNDMPIEAAASCKLILESKSGTGSQASTSSLLEIQFDLAQMFSFETSFARGDDLPRYVAEIRAARTKYLGVYNSKTKKFEPTEDDPLLLPIQKGSLPNIELKFSEEMLISSMSENYSKRNKKSDLVNRIYAACITIKPHFYPGNASSSMTLFKTDRNNPLKKEGTISEDELEETIGENGTVTLKRDAEEEMKLDRRGTYTTEFYIFPSLSLPVPEGSKNFRQRLETILLLLSRGVPKSFLGLVKQYIKGKKSPFEVAGHFPKDGDSYSRFYARVDMHGRFSPVLLVEGVSYVCDRIDRYGRPSRYRVRLSGTIVSSGYAD